MCKHAMKCPRHLWSRLAALVWVASAGASEPVWNQAIDYQPESITITTGSGEPGYIQQAELGLQQPGGSSFGASVAQWKDPVSGTHWAVVGAPGDDAGKGAAYVFELTPGAHQWHQLQRIVPSDGAAGDFFGSAVAIDGNTIAVGAPNHTSAGHVKSGQAYVYVVDFTSGAVTAQSRVYAAASDNAQTGTSIALAGDNLLIGAPNGLTNGAVWFAKRSGTTWSYTQALVPFGSVSGTTFGASISIDGSRVLIGMPSDSSSHVSNGLAFTFIYDGSNWNQEQRLSAPDAADYNHFGSGVALRGNAAVVGARDHNAAQGAAYSFQLIAGWTYESTLSVAGSSQFGYSVSLADGLLAVGAPGINLYSGQSYLFSGSPANWTALPLENSGVLGIFGVSVSLDSSELLAGAPDDYYGAVASYGFDGTSWASQINLTAMDVYADYFGSAAAISSDTAVIDSVFSESSSASTSFVNIYGRDQKGIWQLEQSISRTAGDDVSDVNFCSLAAIDGDTIGIGDPRQSFGDSSDSDKGAAYIYKRGESAWTRDAVLLDFSGAGGDDFGCSVSLSGNTAVVGAPGANSNIGSAFVFVQSGGTWGLQQRLTPSDGVSRDYFGVATAVSGNTLVVGAPYHAGKGAAYLYTRSGTTWTFQHEITAADSMSGDHFGAPVTMAGNTLAIGAPRKSPNGGVYIYTISGGAATLQQQLDHTSARAFFGIALGLYGNQLVVGADNTVHIYERKSSTWSPRAIMEGNSAGSFLGGAVGISSGNILATSDHEAGGRAYIFQDDRIFADGFD